MTTRRGGAIHIMGCLRRQVCCDTHGPFGPFSPPAVWSLLRRPRRPGYAFSLRACGGSRGVVGRWEWFRLLHLERLRIVPVIGPGSHCGASTEFSKLVLGRGPWSATSRVRAPGSGMRQGEYVRSWCTCQAGASQAVWDSMKLEGTPYPVRVAAGSLYYGTRSVRQDVRPPPRRPRFPDAPVSVPGMAAGILPYTGLAGHQRGF